MHIEKFIKSKWMSVKILKISLNFRGGEREFFQDLGVSQDLLNLQK